MIPAGDIYRYDNAPHERWGSLKSFPRHFHDGAESHVVESQLAEEPEQAIRQVLDFVRKKLTSSG